MKSVDLPGPAAKQFRATENYVPAEKYIPVSCDFTDELEVLSIKNREIRVHYFNDEGALTSGTGCIIDIPTREHVDYITLSSGEEIRLDRIERIQGEK